jgi:hypothetical protein
LFEGRAASVAIIQIRGAQSYNANNCFLIHQQVKQSHNSTTPKKVMLERQSSERSWRNMGVQSLKVHHGKSLILFEMTNL